MIFQSQIKIDWESIKSNKRKLVAYNNERENRNRIEHEYHAGDKILIIIKKNDVKAKLDERTEAPYKIIQIYENGTIKIQKDKYEETISIRRIKPSVGKN